MTAIGGTKAQSSASAPRRYGTPIPLAVTWTRGVGRAVQLFRNTVPPVPMGGKESHVLAPQAGLSNFIRGTCVRDPGINRPLIWLTQKRANPDAVSSICFRDGNDGLGLGPPESCGSCRSGQAAALTPAFARRR